MVNDMIQLSFGHPDFVPIPGGSGHYVAAVQNKAGELEALRHASPETWNRLTPLVEVVGPKKRPDTYRRTTVAGWVKRVAEAVGGRPCFLDVLRLRPEDPTATPDGTLPVLSAIHTAARRHGMAFVPVLPVGGKNSKEHARLVRCAAAVDGRGAALRYPVRRVALEPGATHTTVLSDALDRLEIDVSSADVLVDLGFLSADEELHAEDVGEALSEVSAAGAWRSVVLLGTSMPSMLGGTVVEGTVGEIPRREWELWSTLRGAGVGRLPTFGDYVIQHPDPPHDTGGGPGMRANIRYTTDGPTLVARGRGPLVQEGRSQYRGLCQQLVGRSEFAGQDFSWGDAQIVDCANGASEPGWKDHWRGAGSSHHFCVVTKQVSR